MADTSVAKTETRELTRAEQQAKSAWGLLNDMKKSIAMVLPKHITPERMAMIAYSSIRKNPKLLECNAASIIASMMTASMLGLEPSGPLGHGYLIPYWNSNRDGRGKGGMECQFQPGYQGLLDLARRTGLIKDVQLREVYEGDEYSFRYGLHPDLTHIPLEGEGASNPDRKVTNVYAVITFVNGGLQWEQMSMDEALAHAKRFSQSWIPTDKKFRSGTPWAEHPVAMALKTVLKKVLKLCPKSPEMSSTLLLDDMSGRSAQLKMIEDSHEFDVDFSDVGDQENQRGHANVDLSHVTPGEENNRGHGNEGMEGIAGTGNTAGQTTDKPADKPVDAQSSGANPPTREPRHAGIAVNNADWDLLNSACKVHKVTEKQMSDYITTKLGYKRASYLKNDDFDGLLAWIKNGGKEIEKEGAN